MSEITARERTKHQRYLDEHVKESGIFDLTAAVLDAWESTIEAFDDALEAAEAERDAARAEVARLRAVLLLTLPHVSQHIYIKAREALAQEGK